CSSDSRRKIAPIMGEINMEIMNHFQGFLPFMEAKYPTPIEHIVQSTTPPKITIMVLFPLNDYFS
ncbi:MAG TPA: hypothetical protein VFB91_07395, partial [Terriglobales bacterium]|nr:hypothetical protein [Terriglobales bacterium]